MTPALASIARNGAVHVLFAFTVMGSWAVFANQAYPMPTPLAAGMVQGTISAVITFFLKTTIERLAVRFAGLTALLAPPLIACSVSLCALVVIHQLSGTPELLKTIAFPFLVAASYAALYSISLWRTQRHS